MSCVCQVLQIGRSLQGTARMEPITEFEKEVDGEVSSFRLDQEIYIPKCWWRAEG